MNSIYGSYREKLELILNDLTEKIEDLNKAVKDARGEGIYEHLTARVKSEESMREKCRRKGLSEDERSALEEIHDAIGIRIVCSFIDDIYEIVSLIKGFENIEIVEEKDYVRNVKPNGYRSYHMVIAIRTDFADCMGRNPGKCYAEIQLRTIAMDSWASLEHRLKYKKDVKNQQLIVAELKKCADELASCDLSMQTIRDLINGWSSNDL